MSSQAWLTWRDQSPTPPARTPSSSSETRGGEAGRRQSSNWLRVSWTRSQHALGDNDAPAVEFVDRAASETVLTRAARPVLSEMAATIADEPVSLILTDANGVVLLRIGGDSALLRALDQVDLAPGFRYSESQVGTNAIGTALEVGTPLVVVGNQHFIGPLRTFSCAGALVTHPTTGAVLGVVDLTTKAEYTNALLLSFAKVAAARIRERILQDGEDLNRTVFTAYRAATQHSGRPTVAVGDDILMLSESTQQRFDMRDQMVIIDLARDARGHAEAYALTTDLPSGTTARLSYQPTFATGRLAGGIITITERKPLRSSRTVHSISLPGAVGESALWRRAAGIVVDACRQGEWMVLDGEPGVGKTTLISAAHRHLHPTRRLVTLNADIDDHVDLVARVETETETDTGVDLAILHAHRLDESDAAALAAALQALQPGESWVALTVNGESPLTDELLQLFPASLTVPPLRQHIEDVPHLVPALLAAAGAPDLTLSRAALQPLMRMAWPGNIAQLTNILSEVHRYRRSGVVQPEDLPAECHATARRSLSRLESLQRDAIVDALVVYDGDKTTAAKALGMSRATMYRKIREYGIIP